MKRVTEEESTHHALETLSTGDILKGINAEDKTVPLAVEKALTSIEKLVDAALQNMLKGGRLFYMGAGTSGRLGIVDASECPPTYGVPHGLVNGIIAGGDTAIRKAVEFAEDDPEQGWKDLQAFHVNENDFIIGIAASGTTPYVIGAIESARKHGLLTGCITCNPASPLAQVSQFPIEVIVGPEFVTGSTRMKSGTAQKLVLNMISTTLMIRLGKVKGNRMVDMQLSNNKLIDRGIKMVMDELKISFDQARVLLEKYGSVRKAVDAIKGGQEQF